MRSHVEDRLSTAAEMSASVTSVSMMHWPRYNKRAAWGREPVAVELNIHLLLGGLNNDPLRVFDFPQPLDCRPRQPPEAALVGIVEVERHEIRIFERFGPHIASDGLGLFERALDRIKLTEIFEHPVSKGASECANPQLGFEQRVGRIVWLIATDVVQLFRRVYALKFHRSSSISRV